jgi:ribulose-phosphate 3-epimerase
MADICPTLTAYNAHEYRTQMERLEPFAKRIHIDLMDGKFAKVKSVAPEKIWWPPRLRADLHVMYKKPFELNHLFIALHPELVVVQAEAKGNFGDFAAQMHAHGIKVGVALLQPTQVDTIAGALGLIDHVLIFSGNLGYQGGSKADASLVPKIKTLRQLKPSLEIGWDGGVNDRNAAAIINAGVDVLNVGGFIAHADNPQAAYARLETVVTQRS